MKATTKDLRFNTREILETASRGEEVIITFRGKPKVRIVPIETGSNKETKQTNLFGIWKDNDQVKDVEQYVRDLRKDRE